jgi:hypothetical protein
MKKIRLFLFLSLLATWVGLNAQDTYSEDFESYNVGDYMGVVAPANWSTWSNAPGGDEDVQVSDAKAVSGTKCIFINNTNPNGGPTDALFKLGGKRSKGYMDISWKLFIEAGANAYWNFQSNPAPGTFAMDILILPDGTFNVNSGGWSNNILQFPIGEWADINLKIDISRNMWSMYINGVCAGVFRSVSTAVAAIDFYANVGSKYYIDDMQYTYTADSPALGANEAGLVDATFSGRQIAGEAVKPSFTIYNAGTDTIRQIVYKVESGNFSVQDTLALTLPPNKSKVLNLDNEIILADGKNDMQVTLLQVNGADDNFTCNNSISGQLEAVLPVPHRKFLVEEATGTWCGWCPRGTVSLAFMKDVYPDYIVPVAVHNGDPMTLAAYDNFMGAFPGFSGYPSVIVDRTDLVDPTAGVATGLKYLKVDPDAIITLGAVALDSAANKLDVSVKLNFLKSVDAGFDLFLTLTEDNVKGTAAGYNQTNYYSGGSQGVMGGFETLPNPVPAAQMKYDHVGRTFNVYKDLKAFEAGDSTAVNFSINLTKTWNRDNLLIVAALLNNENKVSNVNYSSIKDAVAAGYVLKNKEQVIASSDLTVFPNPATGSAKVNMTLPNSTPVQVTLIDMTGKTVYNNNAGTMQGSVSLNLPLESISSGIYTVQIRTNAGISTTKLNVIK